MKKSVFFLLAVFAITLSAAGCAQKTASEQLKDDMNKAASNMQKEMGKL